MAKRSAAAAVVSRESRSSHGAVHAVRLFKRMNHRFFRLLRLGAATPKTGRRTAKCARRVVVRPAREPKTLGLGAADEEEKQEHGVVVVEEARRSPDAAAATDASASASEEAVEAADEEKQEHDVEEAQSPDAAAATDASVSEEAVAGKYWAHRHSLFSLYDRGVRMDAEGWYSTTPESIAASQAARAAPGDLVVDAFAGCGGNAIQFAARGCYVLAVEIDPRKVELAAHNARVYGVEDRIEFVVGDFFRLAPFLKADFVFLSPPWGGPSYIEAPVYTLEMLKPKDGYATFQAAQKIAPNIMMFLPRTVDVTQVEELSWLSCPPLDFESEENYVDHRFKGITAYFGGR